MGGANAGFCRRDLDEARFSKKSRVRKWFKFESRAKNFRPRRNGKVKKKLERGRSRFASASEKCGRSSRAHGQGYGEVGTIGEIEKKAYEKEKMRLLESQQAMGQRFREYQRKA